MDRGDAERGDWKEHLAADIVRVLEQTVADARAALGANLEAVVLFGSGAEGRLRATSDVNLIFVLTTFETSAAAGWRAALQASAAAINLQPMLLLASEVENAIEAFAVKFADIATRRQVLFGTDPFASIAVSRDATLRRVRQVLLNLALRLRQAALLFNESGATRAIVDSLGPLRASSMALLKLEGREAPTPRAALEIATAGLDQSALRALERARHLREQGDLAGEEALETLLALSRTAAFLGDRAKRLA